MLKALGRICLAGIFVLGGYEAFMEPKPRTKRLPNIGMEESEMLVQVNGAAMVVGGVALALGILPRLTALGLIGSLLPTTLAGHPFWKETEEATLKQQRLQFAKNLGLMGGLLWVLAESGNSSSETD